MTAHQEKAYEKLFKWTQNECTKIRHESPEISVELRKAMHAFRLRPILFTACIDELSSVRSNALSRSFSAALSVGGPGGIPKPIDFHAHDPLRYVGDLLAWVHQACLGELEMLETIFGIASASHRRRISVKVPQALEHVEGYYQSEEALLDVLDKHACAIIPLLSVFLPFT